MKFVIEIGEDWGDNARHQPRLGLQDREPISQATGRRRKFEADESTADHNDIAASASRSLISTASASVRK